MKKRQGDMNTEHKRCAAAHIQQHLNGGILEADMLIAGSSVISRIISRHGASVNHNRLNQRETTRQADT